MRANGSVGRAWRGTLALMAGAAVLSAGCSSGGSGNDDGTADGTSATAANPAGANASTATSTAAGGGGSGTGSTAPGLPIASAQGYGVDSDSNADIPLTIDVLSLDRASNDTVLLRFAVTNESPTLNLPVGNDMGSGVLRDDVSGISLIDLSQNLRYLVLVDADGSCLCSQTTTDAELVPGQKREYEAQFPEPPASTEAVDVQIGPFGIVHDVPLGGGGGNA